MKILIYISGDPARDWANVAATFPEHEFLYAANAEEAADAIPEAEILVSEGATIEAAPVLLEAALQCNNLKVEGLMTIAPLNKYHELATKCFERLRNLRDSLAIKFGAPLPELSMGMTGDMTQAIEAGSTLIRIGTALYGEREYQ